MSKPRWWIVAANIYHDMAMKWRLSRGCYRSSIGSTHWALSTEESVCYVNRVFDDYLRFGGLTEAQIKGARVLEIGPGDNLGVALRFYARGASQVVCLDKFRAERNADKQLLIYRKLRDGMSESERVRYDQAIDVSTGTINEDCVRYIYGQEARDADVLLGECAIDLVISRAVLWEIFEIDATLDALDRVLVPGGRMVHKVACIDWMFRQDGYHPLEFLTVPDSIYRLMAAHSGKSNRRTIDYYRRKFDELGHDAAFHVTKVVGGQEEFGPGVVTLVEGIHYTPDTLQQVEAIRLRLLPRYRKLALHDLMVEDMFIVTQKLGKASALERSA